MSTRAPDLYEFGPFRMDVQRRVFTRGGHAIPLAPKTLDLLVLLVRSDGRAVSKQELTTALWPDTFVEEANLSFRISALRKALGESGSRWIETLPRHGYRWSRPCATGSRGPKRRSNIAIERRRSQLPWSSC